MSAGKTKESRGINKKAKTQGKGITAFQTDCQRRDSKLIPDGITEGCTVYTEAFNAHEAALLALRADYNRSTFLAERAASKALAALR